MENITIELGQLLFPLALLTLFWGLGFFDKNLTAWFFKWKCWKMLIICLLSWILFALSIIYVLYKKGLLINHI
ncbi:MAG: hypothetical protein PHF86_01400 [Candidatus Nanoarchaeia archaeon]|jgi:hypothetical protein|nr:hypothetical protein [Candidatus Nanoarchaeia archaeon]